MSEVPFAIHPDSILVAKALAKKGVRFDDEIRWPDGSVISRILPERTIFLDDNRVLRRDGTIRPRRRRRKHRNQS